MAVDYCGFTMEQLKLCRIEEQTEATVERVRQAVSRLPGRAR